MTFEADKRTVIDENENGDKVKYLIAEDSNLKSITDPAGYTYNMSYTRNNISKSIFPDGSTETFVYDAQGNMKKRTTRNGKNILFQVMADGTLVSFFIIIIIIIIKQNN